MPHLPYGGTEAWQNAVGDSFCYFPVTANAPFIVEDANQDPRTAGHPAIGPWGVGAWAGHPIVAADGQPIGNFCVIDASARFRLAPGDLRLLYTDSAVEARPAPGSPEPRQPMFDDEALVRTLADSHGLGAAATTSRIADALAARHDGWASDGTALLALYLPSA